MCGDASCPVGAQSLAALMGWNARAVVWGPREGTATTTSVSVLVTVPPCRARVPLRARVRTTAYADVHKHG